MSVRIWPSLTKTVQKLKQLALNGTKRKNLYAEAGADMQKLAKWKPENVVIEQSPAMTLQEEVETALKDIGCILDADTDRGQKHPIMDGEKHRITVEGDKKGEKSGFYIIHTDGHPAGFMQNNRTKEELRWSSKGYVQSDEEKALLRAQAAQKQAEKAAQQQKDHESSAKRVEKQLAKLNEPQQQTAYLEKKGLQVHKGVFTDKEGQKTFIPAYDVQGVSNGPCSTSTRTAQNVLPRTPVKRDVSMSLAGWTRLKNPRC